MQLLNCGPNSSPEPTASTTKVKFLSAAHPIAAQYIVVLKSDAALDVQSISTSLAQRFDGEVLQVYEHALKGFSVRLSETQARALANESAVLYVQEDGRAALNETQYKPSWGLDRLDQRDLPLSKTYTPDPYGGTGVHVYVIDTGVRTTHQEFIGRIGNGADFVDDGIDSVEDCHGHGTHVAATIAGTTFGVAKKAIIHPVRAQDCLGEGPDSMVLKAVDWVYANRINPAVVNMSLHTQTLPALEEAIRASIASGITYVFAAGNKSLDACAFTPARVKEGLTVGASTRSDHRALFSNHGPCIDLFAPGQEILSAGMESDTAWKTRSGTSMAAPHVSGAAALFLSRNLKATPDEVATYITEGASKDKLFIGRAEEPNTPNVLLYLTPPDLPTCSLDAQPSVGTTLDSYAVRWNASDATWCTWELDGADQGSVACNGLHVFSQPTAGIHTITLWASNSLGQGHCTASVTVKPTCSVSIFPADGSLLANTQFKVSWVSDAAKCWYQKDEVNQGEVSCSGAAFFSASTFGSGPHTLSLTAASAHASTDCTSNAITVTP